MALASRVKRSNVVTPTLRNGMAVVAIIVLALAPVAPITGSADTPPGSPPPTLVLQGMVRDFEYPPLVNARNYNPDFQTDGGCGVDTLIVSDFLGEDGRPIYTGGSNGGCRTTHGPDKFDMWFRDTPGWNLAVPYEITANLVEGSDPPRYQYRSNSFFPIDNAGWNDPSFPNKQLARANDGLLHNFSFTYQLHTRFTFRGGEVFDFRGDDDVWVFINGRKALDLGGLHPPVDGSITLDEEFAETFGLVTGASYSFDLFFAERHTDSSSLGFTTSLELQNPPLVSVDGVVHGATYEFGDVPAPGCTADDPDAGTVTHPAPSISDIEGPFSDHGVGGQTVTCSYTGPSGLSGSASATYEITDTPVLIEPDDLTVEATGPGDETVAFADPQSSEDDALPVSVTCLPESGSSFPFGATTVECTAMNGLEVTSEPVRFTITVVDTTAPVMSPTTNITAAATGPDGAIVTYSSPAAVDLVDGARATTCVPASGSTFALGSTTVNCSASDTRGNASSTSFTVGVDDEGAPIVTVAPNTTVEATGPDGAIVTFADASAFDVVDGPVAATCSPASGTTFALGSTTVTCSATDEAGNVGTNTLTVGVRDTTPPTIGTVADILTVADASGTATVNYTPPPATDDSAGELPVACQPPSGFAFALGTTTVTCTATDPSGNSASSRFRVVVDEPAQSVAVTPPLTVAPTTTTTAPAPTTTTTVPAPTTTTTPPPTTPVVTAPTILPNTAVLTAPSPTIAPAPATRAVTTPTPTPAPTPAPPPAPQGATVLSQEFAAPAPPAPAAIPNPVTPASGTTLAVSTVNGRTTGRPGVTLAINATGYGQCDRVYFFFNGDRIGAAAPDEVGRVTLNGASVPGGAASGPGRVSSSCSENGTTLPDEAPFVVSDEALHRSALVTALSLPGQVSTDPVQLAVSAGIGVTLMAAIAFPAEIFNATLEENYSEIRSWFRVPAKAAAAATTAGQAKVFGVFSLAGGALFAALSPDFGFSLTTLALVVGMAGAVALTAIGFGIPANLVMRRTTGEWGRIGVLPGALVLAVACVGLSRLVGFQPGYLYGLVAGFTFRHELDKRRSGQLTAAGCLFMLFVSLGAWLLLDPVSAQAAAADAGLWWISLEAGLAATFLIGLEGLAFGLLPLRFLNGSKIIAWSRAAWAGLFGLSLAAFVHIVLRPGSGFSSSTSSTRMITVLAVSLLFVLTSVGLWAYFRWRPDSWAPERAPGEVEFADIERL